MWILLKRVFQQLIHLFLLSLYHLVISFSISSSRVSFVAVVFSATALFSPSVAVASASICPEGDEAAVAFGVAGSGDKCSTDDVTAVAFSAAFPSFLVLL